jgi:hypothetical protein
MMKTRAGSNPSPPPSNSAPGNQPHQLDGISQISPPQACAGGNGGGKEPGKNGPNKVPEDKTSTEDEDDLCPVCKEPCNTDDCRVLKCCGKKIHAECATGFKSALRCQCGKQFQTQHSCQLCRGEAVFNNDGDSLGHFFEHTDDLSGYTYFYFCHACSRSHQGLGNRIEIRSDLFNRLSINCPVPNCRIVQLSSANFYDHHSSQHNHLEECPVPDCEETNTADHLLDSHAACTVQIPSGENSLQLSGTLQQILTQIINHHATLSHCVGYTNALEARLLGSSAIQVPVSSQEELLSHYQQVHCQISCPFCPHTDSPFTLESMATHVLGHDLCVQEQESILPEPEPAPIVEVSTCVEGNDDSPSEEREPEETTLTCPFCSIYLPDDPEVQSVHLEECSGIR